MKQGESQRIYWQQWLGTNYSRRDLITSSAAIRINPDAAKAKDVTKLLRDTLKLSSFQPNNNNKHNNDAADDENDVDTGGGNSNPNKEELKEAEQEKDSLVLVGTLYSLPKDYIQFEHETPIESSDPFHLIKTLSPNDNPLATRDRMMEQLKRLQDQAPSSTSTISPKIQWYFVPRQGTSPIPSCIELDGYCTTMEEEDYDDDDDDDDDGDHDTNNEQHNHSQQQTTSHSDETDTPERDAYYDADLLLSRCPFLEKQTKPLSKSQPTQKQLRRYFQLCQVETCCSGYLLKQSRTDPHVWRKVHCVLTDDYLWYTTRVPYHSSDERLRMAKSHGKIPLSRALLLEPNHSEYTASPLFRVPDAFELVNARGTSHLFRASSRTLQQQWMQAITTKIMESFENSLLDQAELIVEEESMARNRRFTTMAVDPITPPSDDDNSLYLSLIQVNVLRLGMDICEYRELCRHVQVSLPAKQPIVVATSYGSLNSVGEATTSPSHSSSTNPISTLNTKTNGGGESSTARLPTQIQLAWERAASLLDRATHVALEVQQFVLHQTKRPISLSQSLETHCRHIDYVLTGKHRPMGSPTFEMERQSSPPPMDLFDLLLSELQSLVNKK